MSSTSRAQSGDARLVRRLTVGTDDQGQSCLLAVESVPGLPHANGALLQEAWRAASLPPRLNERDDAGRPGSPVPAGGAVVRAYTLPPDPEGFDALGDLHASNSLNVICVLGGQVDLVLERQRVSLGMGDVVVLPGCMHTLSNTTGAPSTILYTTFDASTGT